MQPEEVQARVQTHLQLRELQKSLEQKNQELAEEIELRLDAEKQLETSLEQALLVVEPARTGPVCDRAGADPAEYLFCPRLRQKASALNYKPG